MPLYAQFDGSSVKLPGKLNNTICPQLIDDLGQWPGQAKDTLARFAGRFR